ncbi:HNH endonuclease signature motif containing protein [Salinimonas chungwhensis]|uniref:HNH endonuclease signature motif containing protein n=1 Tax=Salinimonas chungwhensis TaxID=265425 RepID=UPI00037F4089|nr:HNH endonuclease signature motif containing protein [Salinimonas chungwhensis]
MEEKIFNLFLYTDDSDLGLMTKYGVKPHRIGGTDQEKYEYLKSQVPHDYSNAILYEVPKRFISAFPDGSQTEGCIRVSSVIQMLSMNDISMFEEAMQEHKAPEAPLFVNTVIENGKPVGIMATKKAKSSGNTRNALLRRGIDSELTERLIREGHTLSSLKMMKVSELSKLGLHDAQIEAVNDGARPPIPEDTYIKLLYESKRTCCVCRDPSKPIIIHHIEEWSKSKSHDESNLVVLCLEHHDQAHTKKELSIALNKKQLVEFKSTWLKENKTSDAEAILGLVSRDFARWDYFNHARVYELFLTMDIDPTDFKTFSKLNDAGYVDSLGIMNIDAIQKMNARESYMYRDGNGFITAFYMKEVFEAVLAGLPIVDITDKFNRSHIISLLRPGSFIALQAGFYYKKSNTREYGGGQLRRAHYQKRGIKIDFTFDPYEATSSSAYSDSLSGHSVSTVICIVKSIYERNELLNIDVSCLAIGSYLEDCKFRVEQRRSRSI